MHNPSNISDKNPSYLIILKKTSVESNIPIKKYCKLIHHSSIQSYRASQDYKQTKHTKTKFAFKYIISLKIPKKTLHECILQEYYQIKGPLVGTI